MEKEKIMSNNVVVKSSASIGFPGLLTLLFIGLKLTGYIAWSWWWVLSPLWIGFCFILAIVVFALIMAIIAKCLD